MGIQMFDVEFHNVAALEKREGYGGWLLARYPEDLRKSIEMVGPLAAEEAACVEIRFVTDSNIMRLAVSDIGVTNGMVHVYNGDFFHSTHVLEKGKINQVEVKRTYGYEDVEAESVANGYFSPKVWRFVFVECTPILHEINTFGVERRCPTKEEKPRLTWLAYGSSITHHGSPLDGYSYAAHGARRLKVDLLNKGTGGSCYCDTQVADFLSKDCEWDFCTLELGVNMLGKYTTGEFYERVEYLLKTLTSQHPGKHIWAMDIFSNFNDFEKKLTERGQTQKEYRKALKKIVTDINSDFLHYLPAREIQPDLNGLTGDLLHPSIWGHIAMGERLADRISKVIKK